jgi:hypothetical protein
MSLLSSFIRDAEASLRALRGQDPIDVIASPGAVDVLPALGPDKSGAVATAASTLAREDAFTDAALAAMPRIAEALGPNVTGVIVGDEVFRLVARYEDPATGLSAVQLRSTTEAEAVFAIDGSHNGSVADVAADVNLGRPQTNSAAFTTMVDAARHAALAEGQSVVFTGASLGGSIAQVAGYETAEATAAAGTAHPGRVTVFTVDALGGRDAAEGLNGGGLNPAVLADINALNIRTEGDIVSRIGSPIGDTLTFQPVNRAGQPVELAARDAHVNVESLFTTLGNDALYAAGVRGAPEEIGLLTAVANAAGPIAAEVFDELGGLGVVHNRPEPPRLPGVAGYDPTGRFFNVDADANGAVDLRVFFAGTVPGATDLLG